MLAPLNPQSSEQPLCSQTMHACREKERKSYAFRCQVNEKPSIILGCPGMQTKLKIQE